MLDVRYSTRFKKDFKTCVKRGLDVSLFQKAVDTLRIPAPLPEKNREHNLSGNYAARLAVDLPANRHGTIALSDRHSRGSIRNVKPPVSCPSVYAHPITSSLCNSVNVMYRYTSCSPVFHIHLFMTITSPVASTPKSSLQTNG